ncbi:MAG: hypothetical protein KKB50_16585 [Planctomycetes bacterium]|nr:hypothetical protein [Planctomycetota bacterium]
MRPLAFVLIAISASVLQADVLHMRDGTRYYGSLISQDDQLVIFRVTLPDGASGSVRVFPAALINRVERTSRGPIAASSPAPDPREQAAQSEDCQQMVREALELISDEDFPAALRALQHAVQRASPQVLQELDEYTRQTHGLPLAELLAETRLYVAQRPRNGRLFGLTYATRYEAAALGRLLEQRVEGLLATTYHERTIAEWVPQREAYETLQPDARRMVADARLAAAMIGARLRFDPRLRPDRDERRRLTALRGELARFVAHVSALPGFTGLSSSDDASDPAVREVSRLRSTRSAASQPAEKEGP